MFLFLQEIDIIKNAQVKLRNMLERLNTQNSINRASLHDLEIDSADKFKAHSLDSAAQHMGVSSRGLNFHLGIENVDNTYETLKLFGIRDLTSQKLDFFF